jgi:hypothetical protein
MLFGVAVCMAIFLALFVLERMLADADGFGRVIHHIVAALLFILPPLMVAAATQAATSR